MIMTAIAFLPFVTCLYWIVLNPLLQTKGKASGTFELFLAILGFVTIAQAGTMCSNGIAMLSFFLIRQFFTPLLIPAALLYTSAAVSYSGRKPSLQLWIAIPVALIFAETILLILSGTETFINAIGQSPVHGEYDRMTSVIHLCSFRIFYVILAAQLLLWIIRSVITTAKGRRHIQTLNCSGIILATAALEIPGITGSSAWISAVVNIILSCLIFYTSYKSLSAHGRTETAVHETRKSKEPEEFRQESGMIIADAHQSLADEEKLRVRFEDLIVTEQLFLKQGIRISDIASMLETNRTYISRLVNNTYNMSFSDYINTLRIDYAEQYLMHHRDAKQSDIAAACGFPNASAFNNVFKKITGVTPKIWLATRS